MEIPPRPAPEDCLAQGAALLATILEPLGFSFAITEIGRGSGGTFATGAFTRGDHQICLWVRHGTLGGVTYRAGTLEWSHIDYMRALGRGRTALYPGFDIEDPLGSFRLLLADLEHCSEFLAGDGRSIAVRVQSLPPRPRGIGAI